MLELGYTLAERVLIAGRALWFYAGKLVWPAELAVIYPLWEIEAGSLAGWAYVAAAAGLALLLWLGRERIGRGPLAEALYFALTLGPVLGFVDYGYMQFSFVADRFQYLAGSGVLAVLIGAAAHGVGRLRAGERDAAGVHEASVAVLRLDALLPSTGSGAATVPPLHQYYGGAKTPRCPSRRASLPSLGDTMPAPAGSLLCFLGCRSAQAWTLLCRRPSGSPVMETNEASQVPGPPAPHLPCSRTPAGPSCQAILRHAGAAPAHSTTKAPTRSNFRALRGTPVGHTIGRSVRIRPNPLDQQVLQVFRCTPPCRRIPARRRQSEGL